MSQQPWGEFPDEHKSLPFLSDLPSWWNQWSCLVASSTTGCTQQLVNTPSTCHYSPRLWQQKQVLHKGYILYILINCINYYYLCQRGYIFRAVCLSVSRKTENLLAWFSWNLVETCTMGQWRTHLILKRIQVTFFSTLILNLSVSFSLAAPNGGKR